MLSRIDSGETQLTGFVLAPQPKITQGRGKECRTLTIPAAQNLKETSALITNYIINNRVSIDYESVIKTLTQQSRIAALAKRLQWYHRVKEAGPIAYCVLG